MEDMEDTERFLNTAVTQSGKQTGPGVGGIQTGGQRGIKGVGSYGCPTGRSGSFLHLPLPPSQQPMEAGGPSKTKALKVMGLK